MDLCARQCQVQRRQGHRAIADHLDRDAALTEQDHRAHVGLDHRDAIGRQQGVGPRLGQQRLPGRQRLVDDMPCRRKVGCKCLRQGRRRLHQQRLVAVKVGQLKKRAHGLLGRVAIRNAGIGKDAACLIDRMAPEPAAQHRRGRGLHQRHAGT